MRKVRDKPDGYRLVLSDNRFNPIACVIKGDSALVMDEACSAIVSLAPWVFTDNYQEFMDDYTRKTKKKAFMREIEHRKAPWHTQKLMMRRFRWRL